MQQEPADSTDPVRVSAPPDSGAGTHPSSQPGPRLIGPHAALGGGLLKAADRAREIGASAIQVFADNPTAWRRRNEPPSEAAAFRDRLASYGIAPVAIHAAYLINLAGPDPDFFERSIEVLTAEMRAAASYAGRLVNVHIGSHRDTSLEEGVARVAEGLVRVLDAAPAGPDAAPAGPDAAPAGPDAAPAGPDAAPAGPDAAPAGPDTPRLVLENAAGGGWAVGVRIEELAMIAEAAAARGIAPERIGFCLDTAHLWGAGYPLGDPDEVTRLLDDFQRWIGLEHLAMIHLNDSKATLGSRQDRHEHIGAGQIGVAGFARLLTEPRLEAVPFYLETPGMELGYDAINLARARAIAAGEPLEPLPPEALAIKGSRSRAGKRAEPPNEDAESPNEDPEGATDEDPTTSGVAGGAAGDVPGAETGTPGSADGTSRRRSVRGRERTG